MPGGGAVGRGGPAQCQHAVPWILRHLNFLVIGRTLAEEGVGQIIDPLMRMPQVRKGAMVIVAQDTAKKICTIAAKR